MCWNVANYHKIRSFQKCTSSEAQRLQFWVQVPVANTEFQERINEK